MSLQQCLIAGTGPARAGVGGYRELLTPMYVVAQTHTLDKASWSLDLNKDIGVQLVQVP